MLIVGTDEVGRGCIAGPIVAASFALSPQALLSIKYSIENSLKDETRSLHVNRLNRAIKLLEHDLKICSENHTDSHCGLDSKSHSLDDWNTDVLQFVFDSKKVSEKNRQKICNIFAPLKNFAIGQVEAEEIDKKGLQKANIAAMNASNKKFESDKNIFLSDFMHGNEKAVNITKGDENSFVIAVASIIAKTYRDNLMKNYAKEFKNYGFEKHVGYGTKAHLEAIKIHGPCKIHRKSYAIFG